MAAGGWEWDIPYTTTSLSYVARWKSQLVGLAQSFVGATDNSIALAVAGAITREQVGNETARLGRVLFNPPCRNRAAG
jgi:hypothetical protein